jgi:hypothetical protein
MKRLTFLLLLCVSFVVFIMPASAKTDGTNPTIDNVKVVTPVVRPGDPVIPASKKQVIRQVFKVSVSV